MQTMKKTDDMISHLQLYLQTLTMNLFFTMRETKCQIRLIYKGFNCKRKQDRLRMNDSTGSNSHLRSIDRFISMNI